MRKTLIIISFLFSILSSCQFEKKVEEKKEYLRHVGDIEYDDKTDNSNFKICSGEDSILQYFNLEKGPVYSGEKSKILNLFKSKYKPITNKDQNGLIRIRFVVNCEGKSGRFRVLQSDYNYKEIEFDKRVVNQLTDITKGIENWEVLYLSEYTVDYYMYLIFKISDGQIIEILP